MTDAPPPTKAFGALRLSFPSPDEAQAAAAALAPDNEGHAVCRVEGTTLHVEAEAASWPGLLRTLDDVMVCLRALEGAGPETAA
ncbi:MAG: KEOPS complex subunit Pcc1 [Thermoplasmatota archaeon]